MAYRLDQIKEDAIYDWAYSSIGPDVKIIWDKPNEQRPVLPYITLNIIGGPIQVGDRPSNKYKTLDTWTYEFKKRITLSVNIFGYLDHLNKLQILLNCLYLQSKVLILNNAGLACWGFDGPFDMSELVDTEYEFRSHADIFLSYGEQIDDIPREIQSVELNGQIISIT